MKLPSYKPQLYTYIFAELQEIAKGHGYNLLIHGSMNRDCDLVAVPWIDSPKPALDMVNSFYLKLTGRKALEGGEKEIHLIQRLPGGRTSYVINLNRGGYKGEVGESEYVDDPQFYLDISVTPLG